MADISEYIDQIQNAVYGEEVRGSISNSLEAINLEVNKEAFSVTLAAENWAEDSDGYITQIIENEKVFDYSTILISMQTDPTGINLEAAAEYANIYHATVHDGYIKLYTLTEPVEDVPINYLLLSSNSGKVFFAGSGVGGGGGGANLTLRGISIVAQPTKLNYKRGETISTIGMQVRARYNNGSVAEVTSQCTLSTSTAQSTIGQQLITVSYTEDGVTATTAFYITVYQLASIAVTTQPTTRNYKKGATIDTTGMVVTATYTDNHTEVVTEECTLSTNTAASIIGTQNITVSYEEDSIAKTTTLNIIVYELSSIEITTQPNKTTYRIGDTINTTGMVVTALYSNGTSANVTDYCTLASDTVETEESTMFTVLYTEDNDTKATALIITVAVLDYISVTTRPTKTNYLWGEAIDTTGMVVKATYTDGSIDTVTSSCTTSPANAPSSGNSSAISVSYTDGDYTETTSVNITLYELNATIEINALPGGNNIRLAGPEWVYAPEDTSDPGHYYARVHFSGEYSLSFSKGELNSRDEVKVNVSSSQAYYTATINNYTPSWSQMYFMSDGKVMVDYSATLQEDPGEGNFVHLSTLPFDPNGYRNCALFNEYIVTSNGSTYAYSEDGGVTWITKQLPYSFDKIVCIKKFNNVYYFVGRRNVGLTCRAYRTNNLANPPSSSDYIELSNNTWGTVYDFDSDGTYFYAAGTSKSGRIDSPSSFSARRIKCHENNFCEAIGSSGSYSYFYSNDSGTTWTTESFSTGMSTNITDNNCDVNNGLVVADYGLICEGPDGWYYYNSRALTSDKTKGIGYIVNSYGYYLFDNGGIQVAKTVARGEGIEIIPLNLSSLPRCGIIRFI